jgi:hypothetical protein
MAEFVAVDSDEEWRDEDSLCCSKVNRLPEDFDELMCFVEENLDEKEPTEAELVFRHTESYDINSTPEESAHRKVLLVLTRETMDAALVRSSQNYKMSDDFLSRQETEINSAFYDVNYLRAAIASSCDDKTKSTLEKRYLIKYAHASVKELSSRKAYAKIVLNSALKDQHDKINGACINWVYRIQNDEKSRDEWQNIRQNKDLNQTLCLRKKNDFEYYRSKAILKADIKAFKAAYPGLDYSANSTILKPLAEDILVVSYTPIFISFYHLLCVFYSPSLSSSPQAHRITSISELSVQVTEELASALSTGDESTSTIGGGVVGR